MIPKSKVKQIKQLHSKKFRNDSGLFIGEGMKIYKDLIQSNYMAESVFVTEEHFAEVSEISPKQTTVIECSLSEMSQMSALTTAPGILAVIQKKSVKFLIEEIKGKWTLALDSIRDPGNMGTIIRLAHWFGISNIICNSDCVDVYNPKVVQASMGSLFYTNIFSLELESVFSEIQQNNLMNIYGSDMYGRNIYEENFPLSGILIIGNESTGMSDSVSQAVTDSLAIPNFSSNKKADSLNAALACGIILSEIKRKTYNI